MSSTPRAALWRNGNYLVLWSGQLISVLGSRISQISLPLLIIVVTHSPAQAGTVAALFGLPYLLFGLLAGVLIDRWDRKRTMLICSAINCLMTGTIPLALVLGHLSMPQLYVLALVNGSAFVFFDVAELAALPSVVSQEQLPTAVGLNQATFSAGGVAGQPIGGILFQLARPLPFLADTISYAVSVASLLAIRARFQTERLSATRSLRVELIEGMTWLWRHPTIRSLTLLTASSNLLVGSFPLLIILLAQQHHASPSTIGGMFALASAASVVGSAVTPRLLTHLRVGHVAVSFFWLSAALYPLYLLAPNPLAIALINAGAFLVNPVYNIASITYRLNAIPNELQGRVNSSARVLALGAMPLGAAAGGVILQTSGTTAMVWILTLGTGLLALGATLAPSIRSAPHLRV